MTSILSSISSGLDIQAMRQQFQQQHLQQQYSLSIYQPLLQQH